MKRILAIAFLGFASLDSYTQDKQLDSLYSLVNNKRLPNDSSKVKTLLKIAGLVRSFDLSKSKEAAEEALKLSQTLDYVRGEGNANFTLGAYYLEAGEFEKATTLGLEALKIYEKLDYKTGMANCYSMFGRLHTDLRNEEKAIYYWRKSVELNKVLNANSNLAYAYNGLGNVFSNLEKLDSSLYYYQLALKTREEIGSKKGVSQSYGSIAGIYLKQKKYDEAIKYDLKSMALESGSTPARLVTITGRLGRAYLFKKDYLNADKYLSQSLALAKKVGGAKLFVDIYDNLSLLEEERGNPSKALEYERLRSDYKDSLWNEQKNENLTQAEIRFETEKKEHTIELLQKDKKISTLWRSILIAGIIVLTIFFIALYLWQKSKHKKNSQLLNLQVDLLTSKNQELANKYKANALNFAEGEIESSDEKLLKKAITLVETNLSDSLFGVEKMAKEIGMSRASLHNKLKSITGFAPSDFIRNIRLKRAANLLRNNADTISQIGFAVGFEDQSYFSKSFKKQFGVSPKEYAAKTADSVA